MNDKIKTILVIVAIIFIASALPPFMYFSYSRQLTMIQLAISLAFSSFFAILGALISVLKLRKKYGPKWTSVKFEVPVEVRKSIMVRSSIIIGLAVAIIGIAYGIVVQNMMLVWLLMLVGVTIALPGGDLVTRHIPLARTAYNITRLLVILWWIGFLASLLFL